MQLATREQSIREIKYGLYQERARYERLGGIRDRLFCVDAVFFVVLDAVTDYTSKRRKSVT
jgi:hypothetical protein